MSFAVQESIEPRKTPVQARSAVTVDAIHEATIQVLLSHGTDRLTTTRVAARAGVSVGTLYQYYPNKQALLFAVLQRHMGRVAAAVEGACREGHGRPLGEMVRGLMTAFVDAKLERADVSLALYSVAAEMDSFSMIQGMRERGQAALAEMLRTAPGDGIRDVEAKVLMLYAAMAGTTRAVLEAGATPKLVAMLRLELVALAEGYLGFGLQS